MDENRKKLYDQLSANYDMGTFDEFDSDLDNEDNQKVAWQAVGGQDGYGDFGLFQQAIQRSPQAADAVNTGNTENTGSVDAPTDTTAATEPLQPSDDRTATEIQHPTTPKDEPAEDEEIVNEPDAENTVSAPVAEKTVETDVVEPVRYDFTGKDADGAIEMINSLDDDNKRFNAYYDYSEQKMRSGQQKAATGLATARPMQQTMTAPSWSGRYNTLVQEVSDGTGGMTSPLKRGMERHYDRYNQNIDQARGMTDEQLRTRIDQLMTADYGREGDEMRAVDVVPLVQELMARQNGGHAQTIGERIADEYLSSHPELAEEYRKWQRSEAGYDSNTFEATPLTLIDMVKKEIDRRVKVANRLDAQRNIIPTDPVTERSNAVSRGVDITSAYNITDALRSAERVYGTNRFESYVVAFAAKHNMTVPQARERVRELVTMSVAQDIIGALEPSSNAEYVLRKALTDNMVMNLARAGMTLASGAKPGDVGLFDMEDKAMAHYEQTHTSGWDQFMQVVATTSSFVVEGLGGGGFVLPGIVGKVVGNAAMKALSRAGGGLFWKRLVSGSLGGAANFGAFESQMEAVRQLKTGERNPDALWHSLASGLAKGAGFGAVGESIGRLFWHSRGWMVPVGEVVKLAGETATFSAIGYLETGQLTPKDWATNFGMALGGKLTHPVQYIADVKKRMDGGFGPKVQSISGAYRDELTQKGYGTLAKVLHDGVLAQEDIGRVRDELSRMRSDNDVPMQTLQLAEFALNGRVLPCAPATGYRSTHQADGTWTLTPLDPSGRPLGESITVKGTDAKNAAEREMKRQIEKNAVTLSEYSSRGADVTRAVGKAVMSYCDTSGEDPMAVYSVYQEALRKSGNKESLGEVERQILDAVGRRLDDTTRIDNGIESYKRTSREAGYDIDKILDKPVAERTAGERKALDEYKTWLGDREEQAHSDNIADFAEWVQRSDEAAASNSARIAREYEQRAEELRGHVEELRGRMDMGNVVVLENIDQVEDAGVRRQIEQAERKGERGVPGWYDESTDTTYVYLPHAESIEDLDRTIMHEQVTHHGLRVLKTQGYNDLCDRVWNSMSDAERDRWENYPGVKGIDDQTKRQRAAADEYIANLAERTDPESAGLWSRFVAWAKEGMRSLGIRTDRISDAELEQIIRESYRNLRQQRGERVEPTEETEVRQDNEVVLNPEGEAPREEIAEPTADEVAAPTETVEAPADSEDTGTVDTGGDELPVRSAAAQTDGTAADTHDIRELYPNDYGEITGESLDMYLEAAEQSRKQAHDYANGEAERPDENVWRYWASRDGLTDPAERQAEPVATEPIVEETPVQEPAETPVETPAEEIAANDGRLPRGANADATTIDPKDLPESGHIANMADAWGDVTRVEVVGQNADGTTRVKVWFKNRPNQRGIDVNVDMGGTPQPPEPPTTPPSEPTGSTDDQRMSQTLDETLGSEPEVDKTAADYMPMENKGGGRMSPNWEKATAEQVVNYVLREDVTDSPRTMMEERVRVAQERVEKIRKERPFKGDARSAQQERKLSTWQNRLDKAEQQLGKMRQAESALREELIARQRARGEEEIRNRQTIAQLTDTVSDHVDEMDLADYVAYQIGTGKSKLKWKDQEKGTGRTHGLGGHLGLSGSSAERKARRAFIDDKNGLWPEEYAELLYANMPEGLRARYSDRDVLNAVLDVMRGASSRVGIMQDLASRWGSGETLEQRIERERDEWDRQQEEDMREQQEVDEQIRRNDVVATEGAEAVVDADYADLIADARARLADPNASEFEKQAARAVLRFRQRGGRGGASANETTEDEGVQPLYRLRGEEKEHVERSNKRFNEELDRQITGQLSQGHIYNLGRASSILQSAGFPDADIELSSTRLAEKARQHGFGIDDVRNLVSALQEPVAVFSYGDKAKAQNVIAEIVRDGKNFVVGVHFNQVRGNTEVSSIRGLFPKDNAEWMNWVSQGKLLYVDKEKIQTLIDQQRTNPADVDYLDLEDVAKIIKDFENPSVLSENNSKTTENGGISQGFGSAATSLNQVASAMRKIDWKPGTVNVDIGGGRFDKATEYLREQGVESMVFDPFNRDAEHNRQVAERVRDEKVDTVTCNNVLNVIDSASSRANVILQAAKALKTGGTAYFSVYEGDKSGVGRQTKSDSWQNNRVTKDYVSEIERYFDDVTVKGKVIIAKSPKATAEQSVWDFDGTYSGNDMRFRVRDDERRPTFYSNAERAVENVKQGKATAEQWKDMLTKAGGIKAGEDKWMGLSEWLDEHKGQTLTKEEVAQFVADNGIQMEEVGYSEAPDDFESLKREYDKWLHDEGFDYAQEQLRERFGDGADIAFDDLGGELVVANEEAAAAVLGSENIINSTRLDYTTEGLDNKREIAFVVPGIEPYQQHDEIHFGPENGGRAVMWVRFGEARDTDGNRVLVIDEVQSNRHQDARERGYRSQRTESRDYKFHQAADALTAFRKELEQKYGEFFLSDDLTEAETKKYEELRAKLDEADAMPKDEKDYIVPDAPFEKNWMEVAMKRMLRLAAEEGFDKVAWTTGAQQAERYGIGGVVESITKGKTRGENTLVSVQYKNGKHDSWVVAPDGKVVDGGITTGENLSDLIGKELSEKVMSLDENGSISGDGLRIGGEGMKGFYDQIVPSFMRKYVKKWGSQVGEVELATPGGEVMHSVDVTEPMKESVMQGQPLFRVRRAPNGKESNLDERQYDEVRTGNFKRWFGDWENDPEQASKVVDANGEPLVVYHQTNRKQYINRKTGQNWDDLDWREREEWDRRSDEEWNDAWEEQDFYTFDNRYARQSVEYPGFFFSPKYDEYHEYGDRTIAAYLDMKNPAIDPDIPNAGVTDTAGRDAMESLMRQGYDGVIRTEDGVPYEYIVFRPEQIKSATENNGDFSRESGDIRFRVRDREYAEAVAAGDREKVESMLREEAERKGYKEREHYQDAHGAPSADVDRADFRNLDALRRGVEEDGFDANLYALANGISMQPDDYWGARGPRMYMYDDTAGHETHAAITSAMRDIQRQMREHGSVEDMPMVKVYRAVPNDIKGEQLEGGGGQWVSPSRTYAENHGLARFGEGAYRIIEQEVPADELWWDGNDAREWGYDDGILGNVYQNTANNRKLLEPTYDDAGNLIPLSERFDRSNSDVRFRVRGDASGGTADHTTAVEDARRRLESGDASEFERQAARAVIKAYGGGDEPDTPGGGVRFRTRDDADMLVDMVKHNNEVERQRRDAVTDFVKAVTDVDELTDSKFATALGKVMRGQRAYDQATVADITTMVKAMMDTGLLTELDNFAVKQILTKVKDSTGKNDITAEANKLIDIMLKNQLRRGKRAFEQQLKVKGMRQDSRGVVVQGGLDYHGQRAAKALKEGLSLGDLQAVNDRIDEAEQRLSDPDEVVRGNAADELDGLYIARQYYDEIKQSEIDEANIKSQLEQAQADHKNGTLSDEAYKQLRQASNDALRELRCERVDAWARLNEQLSGSQSESAARAKQFREQQKQRQAEIQHWANSDMEGHSADPHEQETRKKSAGDKARDVSQAVLQPLGTFDKLMRYFGNSHPKGEGYLFGFVRRFMNVRDQWFKDRKADFDQMDAAARRIGKAHGARVKVKVAGGKIATRSIKDWADVYTYINQQKPLTVSVKGKDYEITQGNATYLLAMEGQADGRMKLRTMGLTEADMDALRGQVDPMLLELSQWVIHGLLPGMRPRLNATHLRMFGADMTDIPNYFPIRTSELARNETVNLAQQNGKIRPATITGSIIERKRNNLDLDLGADFFQVTAEHIDEMNHWNSFAEFARDLNTLLSYKRFKAQVHNLNSWRYGNGSDIWQTLEDTAAITTGDYQPKTSKADAIINGGIKGLAAANITFRLYTGLKQLLSAPVYLVQARWDDIGYAMANLKGTWQWAIKNLPTFAERWQGRMAGDPILTQGEQERGSQNKKLRTASKWGFAFNAAVDATTVAIGARAIYRTKYRRYKDMGYSDEQANQKALEDAAISVNETQQSGLGAFTSVIQQDRTFWSRMVTLYRNASMGYGRQLAEGLKAMRNGVSAEWRATAREKVAKKLERDGIDSAMAAKVADRLANREAMRGLALAAMFGSIAPFVWSLGQQYLGYKMAGGDDDDQENKMLGQASTHLASGWLEGIVGGATISSLADFAYDYYHGRKKLRDYSLQRDLVSDMAEQILGKSSGKPADAVYDIVNMIVAMSTGVNPKSIVEPTVGIIDVVQNWGGDAKLAHEVALGWCRLLNVPQTSLDQVYIDEIGLSAKDAKQLSAEEFAERWCRYKRRRGAGWMSPLTSDESDAEQEGKLLKRYERMMDERFESLSDERVEQIMRESDDELLKKHAAKAYKSRIAALSDDEIQAAIVPLSDSAPQDSIAIKREGIKRAYESEGLGYDIPSDRERNAQAYERHATYDDIAEDAALKGRKDALKKSVGDEFEKMGVKYKNGSAGWDWYADDDASASIDEIKAYYQSHKAELDEYGILSWWFGTGKGSSGYIKKGFSSKDKSADEVMKEYRDTRKQVLSRTKRR